MVVKSFTKLTTLEAEESPLSCYSLLRYALFPALEASAVHRCMARIVITYVNCRNAIVCCTYDIYGVHQEVWASVRNSRLRGCRAWAESKRSGPTVSDDVGDGLRRGETRFATDIHLPFDRCVLAPPCNLSSTMEPVIQKILVIGGNGFVGEEHTSA